MSDAFARLRPSIHGRRFGLTSTPGELLVDGMSILAGGGAQGNSWYVRPVTGSDTNDGRSPTSAFKTVAKAHSAATASNNDVVYLIAEGASGTASDTTDYQSATLVWSKNLTHLIGICSPTDWSQRARIAQLSSATGVSPLVHVTANGCYFANFSIFHGVADATSLIALTVSGNRNVFDHVGIFGIGNASQVTAGGKSLLLDGAGGATENSFRHCTIGLDTIARDNTVTEINATGGASRHYFEDCFIDAYVSNAGYTFLTIGANGIDRSLIFKRCIFSSKSSNKSITLTSAFSIPAISQGAIILKETALMVDGGTAVWDSSSRGIIWNDGAAVAASGAGGLMTNK